MTAWRHVCACEGIEAQANGVECTKSASIVAGFGHRYAKSAASGALRYAYARNFAGMTSRHPAAP